MQYPQALVASCYEKPEFLLLIESLLGVPSGTVADQYCLTLTRDHRVFEHGPLIFQNKDSDEDTATEKESENDDDDKEGSDVDDDDFELTSLATLQSTSTKRNTKRKSLPKQTIKSQ